MIDVKLSLTHHTLESKQAGNSDKTMWSSRSTAPSISNTVTAPISNNDVVEQFSKNDLAKH